MIINQLYFFPTQMRLRVIEVGPSESGRGDSEDGLPVVGREVVL